MILIANLGERQKEAMEVLDELGESSTGEMEQHGNRTRKQYRCALNKIHKRGLVEKRPNPHYPNENLWRLSGDLDE